MQTASGSNHSLAGAEPAQGGIELAGVTKLFPVKPGFLRRATSFVHAVDDVSLSIPERGAFGIVGESGCGKTTLGKMLVKLIEPSSGSIRFAIGGKPARDISTLSSGETRRFRRDAQMIFQDPYQSLNPRLTVYDLIVEPLNIQRIGSGSERRETVHEMMAQVGLAPVTDFVLRYPHELSGGQRQRVAIARALVMRPKVIVADEPTSMLDVSVRASIMRLMLDLRERMGMTTIYITHDMAVARYMCDELAVMYSGKVIESGPTEDILSEPAHPYTRALLSAVPVPDPTHRRKQVAIKGGIAHPIDPPARCRFLERCVMATERCQQSDHPPLLHWKQGRAVACHELSHSS